MDIFCIFDKCKECNNYIIIIIIAEDSRDKIFFLRDMDVLHKDI